MAFLPGFLPLPFDAGYVSVGLLLVGLGWYGVVRWRRPDSDETVASVASVGALIYRTTSEPFPQ